MMGAGKSTVGSLLAERLAWRFIDLDHRIADRLGLSIPEIFEQHGEAYFRTYEHQMLQECLAGTQESILSLGGGTLDRKANRELLRGYHVIWLDARPEFLYARADTAGRPLAQQGQNAFMERYRRREPLYRELAAYRIDVTGKTPDDVVDQIVARHEA
jgi:shikimate kinase